MPTVKDIIVRKPTAAETQACQDWPVWTHKAEKFDWEYGEVEKCLILEGRVTIYDRPATGQSVSFGPGDYVIFPVGLKCTWRITQAVQKHYDFE
jgi:uncharacterized cupin superfamily protein